MSPDDSFVPTRPLDELATQVIARGRALRRRRVLVQRALPAAALVLVVALVGATRVGDDVETDIRTTDRAGEDVQREPAPASDESPDDADAGTDASGGAAPETTPPTSQGSGSASTVPALRSPHVAFTGTSGGTSGIFVASADGTDARRIAADAGSSFWPSWSGDGERLAFYNDRDGVARVYVVDVDGSDERLLIDLGGDHASQPAWSPVDDVIAFTRFSRPLGQASIGTTTAKGLWLVRADGSGLRQLTAGGAQAAWSPDATEVAFVDADGLHVIEVASGEVRDLAAGANVPRWSPDGRQLAFSRVVDGREQLWVIGADGSGERRLLASQAHDSQPTWTADGASIVFTRDPDGRAGSVSCTVDSCTGGGLAPAGLWLVPAAGGDAVPFIPTTSRGDHHARFAPAR